MVRDSLDKQKFLVTGANGFVGKVLCRQLAADGQKIVGSARSAVDLGAGVQSVVVPSLAAGTNWSSVLARVDVVVHLAARVHVMRDTSADPLAAFRAVNLHGSTNLARQAAAAGVRRFVYVSSIKVNGEHTERKPFSEDDPPAPQDPYAVSKWETEQALYEISRATGMDVVIVRPPLVYGPGVKANFYRLLALAHKGLPLPLAAIQNRRSMVYLGNLVDALMACAVKPQAAGQTFLVCDNESTSTPQLVQKLAIAMHRPSRLFPVPVWALRMAAGVAGKTTIIDRLTQSLEIDGTKICSELDWQPPYTLEQGLQATADWYLADRQREEN